MSEMTESRRELIAHALGLPKHPWRDGARRRRWAYRNHYAAGADAEPHWEAMVAAGWARGWRSPLFDGMIYRVTLAGMTAAGLLPRVPAKMRDAAR